MADSVLYADDLLLFRAIKSQEDSYKMMFLLLMTWYNRTI